MGCLVPPVKSEGSTTTPRRPPQTPASPPGCRGT
jgi:hypothetical protein